MTNTDKKLHWENVYTSKTPNEVSWTQEVPNTSLELILGLKPEKDVAIIDIGGGDSKLVDYLLAEGFQNITILDISEKALQKAQKRLGENAKKINWIVSNITEFEPTQNYTIWHDRATFHFLTNPIEIKAYQKIVTKVLKGHLILGTFSDKGPLKCSGLAIQQYNEVSLTATFDEGFEKLTCCIEDHTTPFNTKQNFLFCTFKRKNS